MRQRHKMKHTIITMIITLLFLVILQGENYADIEDAGEYLKKSVVEKKLSNGVTLIMLNRGYSPTLAFEIAFKVGSSDESYKTTGAAHLLEHMLFKGTDKVGTKDFKKEKVILQKIEAVGETLDKLKILNPKNMMIPGLEKKLKQLQKEHSQYVISSPYDKIYTTNGGVGFNASTSKDKTGYYIELPSSKIKLWAELESERLRNPILREYYLERNNVIQERLMRYDSRGFGSLFERFIAHAFMAHPYRHPIIGWRSNIPFLSIKDVREFYRRYYIPSRMTITIVGKQDTEKTYQLIEKYFGKIESRPDPIATAIQEPLQGGEIRFSYNFESNPNLVIGWHKPTFPSRDDYILDVISEVLAGGKSSRLYKSLVLNKEMASSVSSWNGAPGGRYNNLFIIFTAPKESHDPEAIEKIIYEEIEKMIEDISEKDIQKVLNKMESQQVFGLDTNKGIASMLSYYQVIFDDWKYSANYMKVLKTITTEDVKNTAKKYFRKKNRIVGILYDSRKKK
ncbi:MAG: insulinase family protein [bacterium]|nr:insulinase family protein [bacterium]